MILEVLSPPTSTLLSSIEAAAEECGASTTSQRLARALAHASDMAAQFCGRVLAHASYRERLRVIGYPLPLTRYPVGAVSLFTENGATLTTADYVLDQDSGLIHRLMGSVRVGWAYPYAVDVLIEYDAGYTLGVNLPPSIERAVLEITKALYASGGEEARDPSLRSDSVEGIGSSSYFDPDAANGGLPALAASLLRPLQRVA